MPVVMVVTYCPVRLHSAILLFSKLPFFVTHSIDMLNRRRFLQGLMIAAANPALSLPARAGDGRVGVLLSDPDELLDLPEGFSYKVISRAGDPMSDGLVVPEAHDGMAAFPGPDGRIILVCNHELNPAHQSSSAFGGAFDSVPQSIRDKIYDLGGGKTPGAGGTTTTVYNPERGEAERQHLSLAGTEFNCAGGTTPWGSWLSCEECFESSGSGLQSARWVTREKSHGYVFEVPASETGLAEPRPIKAMGKFQHEAAAVQEATGIVYLTEDRHQGLFYRYLPHEPGRLHEGGRLQALAIEGRPAFSTHNWSNSTAVVAGRALRTHWVDLDDVDSEDDDLRRRGVAAGAATFARGEDLCVADGDFVFTCTIGGRARLGQVFSYRPSPYEGQREESEEPGRLTLIAEADARSLLRHADNVTMAPWGDLLVCEDTGSHCGIVGIRADGSQYHLADNAYSSSELAGVCFSPDGQIMFVNIQYPGTTVAVTGPWPA